MTVEDVKRSSDHLRGELARELGEQSDAFAAEGSEVLLKFHGIYQQDDRDVRRERASKKLPLAYPSSGSPSTASPSWPTGRCA